MEEYMRGSPPGMLTIGAPHSSTARTQASTVRCFLRICAGYWILPQPGDEQEAPDRQPPDEEPAREVRERDAEQRSPVGIVEDAAEEPSVPADRQGVDHHVEEHHEHRGQRDDPDSESAAERQPCEA